MKEKGRGGVRKLSTFGIARAWWYSTCAWVSASLYLSSHATRHTPHTFPPPRLEHIVLLTYNLSSLSASSRSLRNALKLLSPSSFF
jgi:hypothetical protein